MAASVSRADSPASPIVLPETVRDTLFAEAEKADAEECCGLLLGHSNGRIDEIIASTNMASNPAQRFEIAPELLIAAEKEMRRGGRYIIGYYHSHPTGEAIPSATDARLSAGDGRVWAIIAGRDLRLWRNGKDGDVHDRFTEIHYRSGKS